MLVKDGSSVVSELMLVTMLSVFVDPCEMSSAEPALALDRLCGDLNLEDLLRPFFLIWLFKNSNLF